MKLKLFLITVVFALLPTLSIQAQGSATAQNHFDKNGLRFDYPVAWKMTEGGAGESEFAEVAPAGKAAQLIVNWQFGAVLECEVETSRKHAVQTLVNRVATQIHAGAPPQTSWQKMGLGETPAEFIQLRGFISNNLVTADEYSLLLNKYVVTLIYLRGDDDDGAKAAWETIRNSLKVDTTVPVATKEPASGVSKNGTISGGVLNGKAIRLPGVPYPPKARAAGVGGTVLIQVLIDESGAVINTCPISGDSLLQDESAAAARQAKFSVSKLGGKPVRVVGVIQYNFVYQGPH